VVPCAYLSVTKLGSLIYGYRLADVTDCGFARLSGNEVTSVDGSGDGA